MMDPVEKISRLIKQKLEHIEEQLLEGQCRTLEMYQALVHQRELLNTLIADIKDTLTDDDPDGEAGEDAGDND